MTPSHRTCLRWAALTYACLIAVICFMPQPDILEMETPSIQRFGRLIALLRPLNTLWALGDITNPLQVTWVIVQNLLNVFLLYPLVLSLIFLRPPLRSMASAVKFALACSLIIEVTQVIVSLLFDANRVFEIDDLWTNTLGGYLAYLTYIHIRRRFYEKDCSI